MNCLRVRDQPASAATH